MEATAVHKLIDRQTGKITTLYCEGNTLIVVTDTGGKTRLVSKTFADQTAAAQQLVKKEWELLKKGAVMKADTTQAGDTLLHVYIGAGYTGCLSFVATPHGTFVYRPGGNGKVMGLQDELVCIDQDGNITRTLTLPGLLPWRVRYDTQSDQLLLDLDHYIFTYDFATDAFTKLTHQLNLPASFATIAAGTWAYASHPFYYISQSPSSDRAEFALEANIIKGSIPMRASLSPDGKLLALHNVEGKVTLLRTADNSVVMELQGDFGIAEQLIWTKDGKQVIVLNIRGTSRLHIFEIATGNVVTYPGLALPGYAQDVSDCCLNASNTLLVVTQRIHAFVFDFVNKKFLYQFVLSHCVKTAEINFVDKQTLGVRTDYGCFSLYRL
ncbi:MAG: hypothetical protein EOO88_14945 [Pedobacter sp.]|nr:MAG: hypothetical protein EOO88_14945 [Pedobacter sp.]